MSYPVYYVPAGDVLPIMFDTFDGGTGASVTMSGLAVTDIEIYKDGSTTQRASDAGYTLLDTDGIDFDSITGIHGFSVDTGDNTDASFYTVGSWFHVVVSTITVDSQTVSFIAAAFRIMAAEDAAGVPDVNVTHFGGSAGTFASGVPAVNTTLIEGSDATNQIRDSVVDDATRIDASALNTATGTTIPAILDDTDLIDDASSGLAKIATDVAAVLVDTGTTLDGKIDTIDGIVDAILVDTGTTLDGKLDTIDNFLDTEIAAILADTDELQTDLADGGRLDLLVDAIKAKTDQLTFTVANQVDANALTLDEDEILDDSLADSVPADGSLPTVRQALYMIWQFLSEKSVSGTTLTVKKADGSTSLMTFTLDDATNPASITRAT